MNCFATGKAKFGCEASVLNRVVNELVKASHVHLQKGVAKPSPTSPQAVYLQTSIQP
jgi:hypothetical protein